MPLIHINPNIKHSVSQQINILSELYKREQASEIMTRKLIELFELEVNTNLKQLDQLKNDINQFEKKYNIPSDQFFKDFQSGKTSDDMDFIEWFSLIQMVQRLEQRMALLNGEI